MNLYRSFYTANKRPIIEVRKMREKMPPRWPWDVKPEDVPFHSGNVIARFYTMGDYGPGCWDHYYAYLRALKAAGHTLTDKETRRDELADIPADGAL